MESDPATRENRARMAGKYTVSEIDRHSYSSMGPRYELRHAGSTSAAELIPKKK